MRTPPPPLPKKRKGPEPAPVHSPGRSPGHPCPWRPGATSRLATGRAAVPWQRGPGPGVDTRGGRGSPRRRCRTGGAGARGGGGCARRPKGGHAVARHVGHHFFDATGRCGTELAHKTVSCGGGGGGPRVRGSCAVRHRRTEGRVALRVRPPPSAGVEVGTTGNGTCNGSAPPPLPLGAVEACARPAPRGRGRRCKANVSCRHHPNPPTHVGYCSAALSRGMGWSTGGEGVGGDLADPPQPPYGDV